MKLIDISHIISEGMPVYPGDSGVSLTKRKSAETDGFTAYVLQSSMHAGTHVDAPMHLVAEDSRTAADLPLDGFIGNGVLLDVRGEDVIKMKTHYAETVNRGDVVLLHTGFDRYFGTEQYYTQHPLLDRELADFFAAKKIKMLGMDMPSPDRAPYGVHLALSQGGVYLLENLTNLNNLLGLNNFKVMALPLKIAAEASLVRAVAVT